MAIITDHPGFEVTLEVNGSPLPEYNSSPHQDTGAAAGDTEGTPPTLSTPVVKYVEASGGTEFTIRYMYKPPFNPSFTIHPGVFLDGKCIIMPDIECSPKDGHEGYICRGGQTFADGRIYAQRFMFADLAVGESDLLKPVWLHCAEADPS